MKYCDVVERPHLNVVMPPRLVALLAVALALIQLACHGSTVAPTSVSGAPGSNTGGTTVGTSATPFPSAPYTVTGTVTDSRRNPVAGAEVWVYGQYSPIDNHYAAGLTDGAGRYTLQSTQRVPQQVRALKAGYVTRDILTLPPPIVATATWTVDVTILHIDRYVLLSPTSVKVGQSARIEAQVDLDDGSRSTGLFYSWPSSSSNPAVASVDPSTGWIHGIAPGTATITTTYYGVSASIVVRVDP